MWAIIIVMPFVYSNTNDSYSRGTTLPALSLAVRNQLNSPAIVCACSVAPASQGSTAAACVASRITSRLQLSDNDLPYQIRPF